MTEYFLVKDNKEIKDFYRLSSGEDRIDALVNLIPKTHRDAAEKGEWGQWGYNYFYRGSWYIVTQYPPQEAYHVYNDNLNRMRSISRKITRKARGVKPRKRTNNKRRTVK